MEEIWRPVPGYEGVYEVSNYGRIKSLERTIVKSDGVTQVRKERIMCQRIDSDGYVDAKFNVDKISTSIKMHRLVATVFIENPDNLPEVHHIDFNRQNNMVDNLQWCNHKDNIAYSIDCGHGIVGRDNYGKNNYNYGNRKLRAFYKEHQDISKEKQSRPGSQNGRSVPIIMLDEFGNYISEFSYIRECAQFLLDCDIATNSLENSAYKITKALKNNTVAFGLRFIRQ